jgi:hypothetical protein
VLSSPYILDNVFCSPIYFLLSVLSSSHPSDITLSSIISFLSSALYTPRILNNTFSNPIY